jgi:hypothetical protein
MAKYLSLQTARGAMQILLKGSVVESAQTMGCTESDWKLLTGKKVWIGTDRVRVKRLIDALLYATVDTIGLPRFNLPAEYVATVITVFVHPSNYFSACCWTGNFSTSEDLADYHGRLEGVQSLEKVSASRLFALVCQLASGEDVFELINAFKKKTQIEVGAEVLKENDNEIKGKN